MALPHIELLDTFAVWRDYFNFVVDEFNTASSLPSANTIVRRDANGAIAVSTLNFIGTGTETFENKIINAANNTLILSLNDLQDVAISSTANNNQILRYNTTSGNWIVANETVYTEYTDNDVDTHLNKNTAGTNQVLSWTGSDYAWITQTALYSNSDVDTHLNTSTAVTNQILSWTGSDYDWVTAYSDTNVNSHLNTSSAVANQILSWTGTNFGWIDKSAISASYENSDVDTHLNTSTASTNQILSWSGSDYVWITQTALYNNNSVDTHLNTNTASTNQILNWTGSDYSWISQSTIVDGALNTTNAGTGQMLTWNGVDYAWIDQPATSNPYSDNSVDNHLNIGTASANQVLSWTGSDYSWTNFTENDTLDSVMSRGSSTTTTAIIPFLYSTQNDFPDPSSYHGAIAHSHQDAAMFFAHSGSWVQLANDSDIPTAYTDNSVDTHLNTGSATANQVLSWTGTDYNWTDSSTLGGGSSTVSRTTPSETTASIANDTSDNLTITSMCKSYHLLKIQTSAAAWVTLYIDTASRTNDASRNILTDPSPGSGVIAEAITTSAGTVNFTPAVVGWNNDGTPTNNIYAKVVNKSGSTTTITVTLTIIPIEM